MKINDILVEKRRNPEQNPKENVYDFLLKYADDETMFLHTTSVEKVGVNPRRAKHSSDDTPSGVYTYQLKSIVPNLKLGKENNQTVSLALPYYGGPEFYILKATVPVEDTYKNYTKDDLEKDISKLKEKYPAEKIDKFLSIAPSNENFVNAPIGYLWGVTKAIAIGDTSELSHQQYPDPVKWNSVLRYLGHDVLVDTGYGWIHAAESTQALFLDSSSYEIIDHMKVKRKQEIITIGGKEYKGGRLPKDIYLKSISDTEISNLDVTNETKKVRSVTISQTSRLSGVMSLKRIFPNAEIRIEKVITPDVRSLMSPPHGDSLKFVKIDRLIFSEEFPRLPSHIEILEQIKDIPNSIEYTPMSIEDFGRKDIPREEKFSQELYKKIKPYQG